MKVVDVSSWQQYINWDLIKQNEDVDGAIIRVGWGTSYDDECGLDSQYDYNIQNLQRLNIPYDVYIYGYAETEHAANKEADFVIYNLQRYNVPKDTFIWYDAELDIPFDTYRYVIPIFVNKMKAAGYNNVGVYSSVVRLDTSWGNLNDATIRSYPIWVAQYYRKNQYDGEYKVILRLGYVTVFLSAASYSRSEKSTRSYCVKSLKCLPRRTERVDLVNKKPGKDSLLRIA